MSNDAGPKEDWKDEAKDKGTGIIAAVVKTGIVGAGMVAGGPLAAIGAGLAAELVSTVVPNYKQQRYEKWVYELESRVENLEGEAQERAQERLRTPEFADLFEDATRQAVRSLSDERIKQLSNLLLNSLTDDEIEHTQRKRLLDLFSQINDVEVLLLKGKALYQSEADRFWKQHKDVLPEPVAIGSPREAIEKKIVFDTYRSHLADLGLFSPQYREPSGDYDIEFDFSTGKIKASGHKITGLGHLLLREIGLIESTGSE